MDDLTEKARNSGKTARFADWLQGLWPGRCVACAAAAGSDDLCTGCRASLLPNQTCCLRCALPLAEPAVACGRCLRHAPSFDRAWSPWCYASPLDLVVLKLKFGADLAAARVLGELWREQLPLRPPFELDALIPVPLARDRLIERGYNQALELARPLAKSLAKPMHAGWLQRTRATDPQSGLSAKSRKRNLAGAFVADSAVRGKRVAVIDDVMTTGATMQACAKALKRAGAVEVQAWSLARV